jgi:hypothetical protein
VGGPPTGRVWGVAITAVVLTVAVMVAVAFVSPMITAVLVPLAVIFAGIAAMAVPGFLPDPDPVADTDAEPAPPVRPPVTPHSGSVTAEVIFCENRADGVRLDCVVSRVHPKLPDYPAGLPLHVVLAVPESNLLAALSGSLFERWCAEPGIVEVELAPTATPPRATVSKGDARILFEVSNPTIAGG